MISSGYFHPEVLLMAQYEQDGREIDTNTKHKIYAVLLAILIGFDLGWLVGSFF
jgi:hypothetical protein